MAHSFTNLLVHLVFATRGRQTWIDDELRPKLLDHLRTTTRRKKCVPLAVNAMKEHAHILASLHATMTVAELVRDVKSWSSGWIHRTRPDLQQFSWQTGYGGFTVSHSQRDVVQRYIDNQEEHHRTTSLPDEVRRLLRDEGLDYDESVFWE